MTNIIQLGANKGEDHVLEFIKDYDYDKLLLVEAHPTCMRLLTKNYMRFNNVFYECAAIVGDNVDTVDLYYKPNTNLEVSSIFHNHNPLRSQTHVTIPAMTFDHLCNLHDFNDVTHLFIDIEKADEIVINSIDLNKYPLELIVWEDAHTRMNALHPTLLDKLRQNGFAIMSDGQNKIAYKGDPPRIHFNRQRLHLEYTGKNKL